MDLARGGLGMPGAALLFSLWSLFIPNLLSAEQLMLPPPPPLKQHVIVLGIDGLGSHNVWRHEELGTPPPSIPTLSKLMADGAWTLQAQIDEIAVSGPNWMGMLTGAPSSRHGVRSNDCERGAGLETIFGLLRRSQPAISITVIHEWATIYCYPEENSVNTFVKTSTTAETTGAIISALHRDLPDFIFVDYDGVDAAGHKAGGSSSTYRQAVEAVDQGIASVLTTLDELHIADRTYVIVLADHGHRPEGGGHSSAEYPVPFIVYGPGVRPGQISEAVHNNQLAPLLAHLFRSGPSPDWVMGLWPFDRYL